MRRTCSVWSPPPSMRDISWAPPRSGMQAKAVTSPAATRSAVSGAASGHVGAASNLTGAGRHLGVDRTTAHGLPPRLALVAGHGALDERVSLSSPKREGRLVARLRRAWSKRKEPGSSDQLTLSPDACSSAGTAWRPNLLAIDLCLTASSRRQSEAAADVASAGRRARTRSKIRARFVITRRLLLTDGAPRPRWKDSRSPSSSRWCRQTFPLAVARHCATCARSACRYRVSTSTCGRPFCSGSSRLPGNGTPPPALPRTSRVSSL